MTTIDELRTAHAEIEKLADGSARWYISEGVYNLLRAVYRCTLNKRNQRHMDKQDKRERAYARQAAAIAAKMKAYQAAPVPDGVPYRRTTYTELTHRVIAGPSFTEQLRALGKRAQKGQTKR